MCFAQTRKQGAHVKSDTKHRSGCVRSVLLAVLFVFLIGSETSLVLAQSQTKDLEKIKALIKQTQAQLTKNLADSERLQSELKLAELQIAETASIKPITILSEHGLKESNCRSRNSNLSPILRRSKMP
jgi:septal ring factor EnvC (AmiA/AmiB activator)